MKKILFLISILFITGCSSPPATNIPDQPTEIPQVTDNNKIELGFKNDRLITNTAKKSIDITEVLNGGPSKDEIPALNDPKFESIQEADNWLKDNNLGVIYTNKDTTRFYPYGILIWHEIVNDQINNQNIAVTFCPLCGSAIIYDRDHNQETFQFGVSGKLWQSNLLMYDQKTESLWSQITGTAVIGDLTGQKLQTIPTSTITYQQLKENHPNAQILSRNTGFNKQYGRTPYEGYETSDELYFPAKGYSNKSFHPKELFVIINHDNKQIGFLRQTLIDKGQAEINDYKAIVNSDGTISVFFQDQQIPHYLAMWFSWVSHAQDFIIWPASSATSTTKTTEQ